MEQYYFSPSTQGFYCASIHDGDTPQDAFAIDELLYKSLLEGQSKGFSICPPNDKHELPYLAEAKPVSFEEAKTKKLQQIIIETEAAILSGFEYEIDGQVLYFSYQYNDQQNFSDTANMATFGKMGVPGVPAKVVWNGWAMEKNGDGNEISRTLVQVELSNDDFLALYMQGALAHKAKQMAIGSDRKAKVEAATTIEELEAI